MSSLASLQNELVLYSRYLANLSETKAVLTTAIPAIEPACNINLALAVDGLSADGNNIKNIKSDIENLLNNTDSNISQTNNRISQVQSAIRAEEERLRKEAEEAATAAAATQVAAKVASARRK